VFVIFSKNILSKRVAYKILLNLNPGQPDLTGKDDFNDEEAETEATPPVGSRGYHNLETFQRKKLRQKVKINTTLVNKCCIFLPDKNLQHTKINRNMVQLLLIACFFIL
jgi:hypothetical protein